MNSDKSHRYNEDGQTPLHCLCKNRHVSIELVRKALDSNPEACEIQDIYGRTPLYYAIKANCSSTAVIDMLCEMYPQAMMVRDVCGQCPLYMAYRYGIDDALLARLLYYQPHLSLQKTESFSGKTLLESLLIPNWEYQRFGTPEDLWNNTYLMDGWNKLWHTLRAAHACIYPKVVSSQQQQPNSAACGVPPSPPTELQVALDLWRLDMIGLGLLRNMFVLYGYDQAKLPNSTHNGRLPLAAWVSHCNPNTMMMMKTKGTSPTDAPSTSSMSSSGTASTSAPSPPPPPPPPPAVVIGLLDVLQWLIHAYPAAAQTTDAQGQMPLHIALSSSLSLSTSTSSTSISSSSSSPCSTVAPTIVKSPSMSSLSAAAAAAVVTTTVPFSSVAYYQRLINAAPDVLTIPDPVTHLVPFLLASSSPVDADLDTIYTLLREGPHVIRTVLNH